MRLCRAAIVLQFVGLSQCAGQRLLDQHIGAGFHQLASDSEMRDGRDCHRYGVDFCGQQLRN